MIYNHTFGQRGCELQVGHGVGSESDPGVGVQ